MKNYLIILLALTCSFAYSFETNKSNSTMTTIEKTIFAQVDLETIKTATDIEWIVDLTLSKTSDNEVFVSYIDGNPELCEYVQISVETAKIDLPDLEENMALTIDFAK